MGVAAVDIDNLDFSYSSAAHRCFKGLCLKIAAGERFGLFGPNGAGKTTLMNCMTGILNYTSGCILLSGIDIHKEPARAKRLIGLVPQDFAFYQELSPLENLDYFGALSGMKKEEIKKRSAELLGILDLEAVKNKPVHKFSGGMKRKVNLAIGVIHEPALLFLDEPTVGVDIETRRVIIAYLKQLNGKGTTLIYTSHQLSEAQELCTEIALMHEGKIIEQGDPLQLFSKHKEKDLEGLFIRLTGKNYSDIDV